MPSQSYTIMRTVQGVNLPWTSRSRGWQHSPRGASGRLLLTSNPYSDSRKQMLYWSDPDRIGAPQGVQPDQNVARARDLALAESYSRLRGRLYKGSASLGVTIGSYKQSREMIVARSKTLATKVTDLYARAFRSKSAGKDVAGLVLETLFGWQPLLQDIHNAATTVIQLAPVRGSVRGSSVQHYTWDSLDVNPYVYLHVWGHGTIRITRSTLYTVSNPNAWLAERAGLMNPAAVAWDLVPWSFVLNMFSNVGSLVNSITDFMGIDFDGGTIAERRDFQSFQTFKYTFPTWNPVAEYGGSGTEIGRALGSGVTIPPLIFKLPDANWSLAAIAVSLVTQKVSLLRRFFV